MTEPEIALVLVAAVAQNGVIGRHNQLPWHLPGELKQFRARTMGHPLLMGRKTCVSIGRALPGRETVVLTRDTGFAMPGVHVAHDVDGAVAKATKLAQDMGVSSVMVVGGAELYRGLMPQAQRMILTEIDAQPTGDAFFPEFSKAHWQEVSRGVPPKDPRDDADYAIVEYHRIAGSP